MHNDVVVVDGRLVARFPRRPRGLEIARHAIRVLSFVNEAGLPIQTPNVIDDHLGRELGEAYLVVDFMPGSNTDSVDLRSSAVRAALRSLLDAFADIDVSTIPMPPEINRFGGGSELPEIVRETVFPRLSERVAREAERRLDRFTQMPRMNHFVHADLGGEHIRWDAERGRIVGVIDWDLATLDDPAEDAACLGHHGWELPQALFPHDVVERARIRRDAVLIRASAEAVLLGEPELLDHLLDRMADTLGDSA